MLLGIDALIHPGASEPYSTYKVPNIDPSSWVADIGIAAVWMTQHEESGKPPSDAPRKLSSPNFDEYYKMSAPTEDLLGDIDSFGVYAQWSGESMRLSQTLQNYYGVQSGGVKRRWQTFCYANEFFYKKSGSKVTWDTNLRARLIERVNIFNNLYASGKLTLTGAVITGSPSRRGWPHTPAVVDRFLNWVKTNLEAELATGS